MAKIKESVMHMQGDLPSTHEEIRVEQERRSLLGIFKWLGLSSSSLQCAGVILKWVGVILDPLSQTLMKCHARFLVAHNQWANLVALVFMKTDFYSMTASLDRHPCLWLFFFPRQPLPELVRWGLNDLPVRETSARNTCQGINRQKE